MMHGFTFYVGNKDYFVVTDKKNKTRKLAQEILKKLGINHEDEATIKEVLYRTQKATCEIRTCGNGRQYYNIVGNGFMGGSFLDEDKTVIINL